MTRRVHTSNTVPASGSQSKKPDDSGQQHGGHADWHNRQYKQHPINITANSTPTTARSIPPSSAYTNSVPTTPNTNPLIQDRVLDSFQRK